MGIAALSAEFASFSADADREEAPVYDQWLGALGELAGDAPEVAPEFMHTDAWRDKQLNCALASWAMLRHDYLLYGKQAMPPGCISAALVEPVPEFYRRLGALATALDGRGFRGMDGVAELCRNLREMSLVILGEKRLEDVEFGDKYGLYLYHFGHWLLDHFTPHISVHDPTVVVDISSTLQQGSAGVLEAATGPLYPIVATARPEDTPLRPGLPDARYVGVVMSYHEWEVWAEGDAQRMTDEQWRQEIRHGRDRQRRPAWAASFMAP